MDLACTFKMENKTLCTFKMENLYVHFELLKIVKRENFFKERIAFSLKKYSKTFHSCQRSSFAGKELSCPAFRSILGAVYVYTTISVSLLRCKTSHLKAVAV